MTLRFDAGKISGSKRTPSGGLKLDAFVTRVGVFSYRKADGTMQRELRHPDHVFKADSLASLEDAPLTYLHPSGVVNPDNFSKVSIGHVRNPEQHETFVRASVIVQDGSAVKGVEKGTHKELSCGYSCDLVFETGEYNGERYDAIQTNIVYNHLAVGPANWGRAGNAVALHLDSSGDMVFSVKDDQKVETEIIGGIEYKVGSSEHTQALRKSRKDAEDRAASEKTRADAAESAVKTEKTRADAAEGERDVLRSKSQKTDSREVIDAAVTARLALQDKASPILGKDYKFNGKSDREIMIATVQKCDAEFTADDKTEDAYIAGAFRACSVGVGRKDSRARFVDDVATATHGEKPKAGILSKARADNKREQEEAWEKPLTFTSTGVNK